KSTQYCTDATNTCVPSIAYTGSVPISAEGTTYFRYRSTDNAGNVQATVSRTVMIDKSPPVTTCVGCALPNPTPAGEDTTFSPGCADTYSGCKNTTICADASCSATYCGYDFGLSCSIPTILCTYELEKPFWYYSCDNVGNCEAVAGPSIYDVKKTDGCECDASPECINDCAGGICGIWSEPSIDFELNGSGLGISSITICFGKTFRIIVTITNTNPVSIDVPLHIDSFDELKNWVWFTGHRTDGHRRDLNVTVGPFETKRVSIDILGAKTGKYNMYIGPDADYQKKYTELEVKIIYKSRGIFSTTPGIGWSAFMFLIIAGLAITMYGTKRFKH
ncbi:MAG: hypothetical protein KAT83_02700, partial [Candidatus Aenigmarchaeota archaeon]|nr:hypothetical protein [Candidatus Aenigmarchaeota archaeon]